MPSQELVRREFDYQPKTGHLIRKSSGVVAHVIDGKGYYRTSIRTLPYQRFAVHRLIWVMHNGPIPDGLFIDHINRNRTDNRIENLRLVTHKENMRNMSRRIDNRTGITGVQWNKKMYKWTAHLNLWGEKQLYLGSYETKAEAVAARRAAEVCMWHKGKAANVAA